jgi:hypothetical protein
VHIWQTAPARVTEMEHARITVIAMTANRINHLEAMPTSPTGRVL